MYGDTDGWRKWWNGIGAGLREGPGRRKSLGKQEWTQHAHELSQPARAGREDTDSQHMALLQRGHNSRSCPVSCW